ncbi:MAG: flagellar export protein FliJ [Pseudothermotoga sp.]
MFRFRLQRVLHLRESQENQIKMDLAALRYKIRNVEEQITSAQSSILELYRSMLQSSTKGMTGIEIRQWLAYIDIANLNLKKLNEELRSLREEEELLVDQYLTARRERKILQNLRARRFKNYVFEQDRLNRLYLDEVALRKVTRSER